MDVDNTTVVDNTDIVSISDSGAGGWGDSTGYDGFRLGR